MAIPLTVAWELVRLHLHNRRQPPYSKPWKPVSGDGKSHSTNFCDRSIIMQTAVTESLLPKVVMTFKMLSQCYFLATGLCKKIISLCDPTTFLTTAVNSHGLIVPLPMQSHRLFLVRTTFNTFRIVVRLDITALNVERWTSPEGYNRDCAVRQAL